VTARNEEFVVDKTPTGRKRLVKWLAAAGLLAAGLIGGGILGSTLSASADPTATPSGSSTSTRTPDPDSSTPVRSDEQAVSSALEAELKAAALKAVPGGTVIRVETDAGDAEYEAHMRKADGTLVTVKFDASKAVIGVEDGMGKGDPGHRR
jgi:hypothetical protein